MAISAEDNSNEINAQIYKTWNKLTPSEIAFYHCKLDKFFAAIKAKYNIDKHEASCTLKTLENICVVGLNDKSSAYNNRFLVQTSRDQPSFRFFSATLAQFFSVTKCLDLKI